MLLSECEEKEIKNNLTAVQLEEYVENFLKSFIYKVFDNGVISGISQIASLLNSFL
jgi:hypothetical protein